MDAFSVVSPIVVLRNTESCSGEVARNFFAFSQTTPHNRRVMHGIATADLNLDGFPDIVSLRFACVLMLASIELPYETATTIIVAILSLP